jgi:hypothetical protein
MYCYQCFFLSLNVTSFALLCCSGNAFPRMSRGHYTTEASHLYANYLSPTGAEKVSLAGMTELNVLSDSAAKCPVGLE